MKREKIKQNSGITLIALVVTIIVLIILATISINAVLGENGLIQKAEQAKEMQANAQFKESEAMNTLVAEYDNKMAEPPVDPTANWDLSKVTKVTSEDKVVVPVPIGYTASTVTGEKSVSTGFVIKQGSDGSLTSGVNEFVWVPVSKISDLYDSTKNAGQLWNFGTSSSPKNPAEKRTYPTTANSGYREPDVVTKASSGSDSSSGTGYDKVSTNLQQAGLTSSATVADFKEQLQREFKEMKDSVERYGGFYIGRYETGNLSKTTAVVQKYNTDIGSQTWYKQYKLSKTVAANSNVTTSMIWGCQWDATLRWMQTSSVEKVKNFATNSANYGNYKDNTLTYKTSATGTETTQTSGNTVIPTGGSEKTNINNIYDMAGNVHDWTIEAYGADYRTRRGGGYSSSGSGYPSSNRGDVFPTGSYSSTGSRLTLYVAL